ncbi:MAG: AsmA family protein [Planctomycetes bacterium]|nr:AsmA family protein [Planctomycetota bacterium]
MKKKIINGLLIAVIVLVGLSIVGIMVLDGVAQSVIQSKGSEGLGVKLSIESAHVGFFTKESSLKGIKIANPQSFVSEKTPTLLTMDEAKIEFSVLQMLDKEVVIPTVTVTGVTLDLQQHNGKSNIETLVNNISSDKTPEATHPEPPFNIETLTIRDITVVASGKFTILDKGAVTAHIKEIVMHNIGTDGDAEVATEAITSAVTHAIMKHLSEHPAEGFSKLALSNVTGLINSLPVFKQLGIGNAIQGIGDSAGKIVDGVLGGIGGLLGGGNKE